MAKIEGEILKPEESFGGFQAGGADDETFLLEQFGGYPGDLPYLSGSQPEPIKETLSEEPLVDAKPAIEVKDETLYPPDIPDEAPFKSAQNESEYILEKENDIPADFVPPPAQNQTQESFDDDFLKSLQDDLNGKKPAKKAKEPEPPQTQESEIKGDDFKPVEELGPTEFIDLSGIEFKRSQEANDKNSSKAEKTAKKVKKEKPIKVKKERKPLNKKLILTVLLSLLGAALIAGGAYYWFFMRDSLFSPVYLAQKPKTTKNENAKPKEEPKKEEIKKEESKPEIAEKTETSGKEESKNEVKAQEVETTVKVEKEKQIKEIKQKTEKEDKLKKTNSLKKETKQKESKPVTITESKPKKEKVSKQKKESKSSEEYALQIYSTPSKQEAKAVSKKWSSLSGKNASIDEYKVKDKIWQRVRLKGFATKESAIEEAKKLGVENYWVDRIK